MVSVMDVAAYIYNRYSRENGSIIDEMKLHKLLYFAQRESLIQTEEPLFPEIFYGWKYGPVLKEIREAYHNGDLHAMNMEPDGEKFRSIMDYVFQNYAGKNSWSLSRLTHGELSWINSRQGTPENENSDAPMLLEDIRKDAERIKRRRMMLNDLGLR